MNAPRDKGMRVKDISLEKFFGYKRSIPDNITVTNRDEFLEMLGAVDATDLLSNIYFAIDAPQKNAFKRMSLHQALLRRAGLYIMMLQDENKFLLKELDRMGAGIGERGRKRWTNEEDELLIEMASYDSTTIIDLSKEFGRTPGAIQSRISKLVGIKKLSMEVAGRFIGTLNGELIEGDINGTVSKQ